MEAAAVRWQGEKAGGGEGLGAVGQGSELAARDVEILAGPADGELGRALDAQVIHGPPLAVDADLSAVETVLRAEGIEHLQRVAREWQERRENGQVLVESGDGI